MPGYVKRERTYLCDGCKALETPLPVRKCKGCTALKMAAHYQRHRDAILAENRKWKAANPERARELKRESKRRIWARDPERRKLLLQKKNEWRRANPEKEATWKKNWRAANWDHYVATRAALYSRKQYGEFGEAHRTLQKLKEEVKKCRKQKT